MKELFCVLVRIRSQAVLSLGRRFSCPLLVRSLMVLLRLFFSALEASGMQEPTSGALLLLMEPTQNQGKLLPSTSMIAY
jgi:hypothetical protein